MKISIHKHFKETIEDKKFAKGESEEQTQEWGAERETLLAEADRQIRRITGKLTEMSSTEQEAIYLMEQRKKLEFEKLLTEQKLIQEQEAIEIIHAEKLAYEKEKMKLDLEYQQQLSKAKQDAVAESSSSCTGTVRMPKLVISKFNGTPQDWVRFGGQFEGQIDKSGAPAVTKFSYLKELVEVKVRKLIDGLPFTESGYNKAVSLPKKRYGQPSEVVNAYVKSILELPHIQDRDIGKIHDFYEKLLFNVESL